VEPTRCRSLRRRLHARLRGQREVPRRLGDDRKARIAPRKHISVELTELRVSVNGDKAEAHFKQVYQSDT
jgi:ASC-1-like (ASCH) protein